MKLDAMTSRLCTIVSAIYEGKVYVGSNLDAPNPYSEMWFIPPTSGMYGRVCFGFDYPIAENGLNEKGLFIDCNTVPETNWSANPDIPDWETWEGWFESGVPDGILAKCSTVDEAIRIFKSYNLFTFNTIKYFIADALGASAILEWTRKGLNILRRPDDMYYHISTNCTLSNLMGGGVPCSRYRLAEKVFKDHKTPNLDLINMVLSSTSYETISPTQVSVVYDLGKLRFSVYLFHNFTEELQFDLMEELGKPASRYELISLFRYPSFAYKVYRESYAKN
jgi:hypothetical protein